MATIDSAIGGLRALILKLNATGSDGFEGLMAVVLTAVTRTAFNIAKSGSQRGRDGQSAFDSGSVRFECKLYDEAISKNELISKIAETIADDDGDTDLWLVASTGTVSTQDRETIEALAGRAGIATLIVDWPTSDVPPLATLLAMAPHEAASFLASKLSANEADIRAKLEAVRSATQFPDRVSDLKLMLERPSLAPAYAVNRNGAYLRAAFENSRTARQVFAQPLAPGDPKISGVLQRVALYKSFASQAFGKPNGAVTAIIGADGNGKSWLFAQAWLNELSKPLVAVLLPERIREPVSQASLEGLVISVLITQTGDSENPISCKRWRRYFDRWKQNKGPQRPRLIVFVDGLNQRESVAWSKVINNLSQLVSDLGGKLVFSCRTPFFRTHLRQQLLDPVEVIEVGEWTNPELERLLMERGTAISNLQKPVLAFLRNPRIFSIAVDLFDKGQIEGFTELSISRLLFEHIRLGAAFETISTHEIVREVRWHAESIIKRIEESSKIDLKVFDRHSGGQNDRQSIDEQLAIVSSGQFFEDLPGEPTLYKLKDESTPLALGLALLGAARRAQRNGIDVTDSISKILDPISAIDNTADVLLSSLIVAVLDGDTPDDIIAALASGYVSLQNLDEHRYAEFRALARRVPSAFLVALETAVLSTGATANLSWLTRTLVESREDAGCWSAIADKCRRWLSMYSTAPERRVIAGFQGSQEERVKEYKKHEGAIQEKLETLSEAEGALLNGLTREERGNYTDLNKMAFTFLAGKRLVDFAESFRNWCFAAALNGGYHDAHDDFQDMIQFNRADWAETRDALLAATETLRSANISDTGRWSLVYILTSTGASSDAKEAEPIFEDLTRDRRKFEGWRLIENWCATDPCDPASVEPDNIAGTATKYAAIDVSKLRGAGGYTREDHFLDGARAGLARFRPDALVGTTRRLARAALTRKNEDFRTAVFLLENHTAALDDGTAVEFLKAADRVANDVLAGKDKHDELFVASQHAMAIAFPHMSGDDQLRTLVAYPKVKNILLNVCDLLRPSKPDRYETALEKAYADGDTVAQFRVLAFGQFTDTDISPRARAIVGDLTTSTDGMVRLCALALVRRLNDPELLRIVAQSDWKAGELDGTSARFEIFYGSEVLVQAVAHGIITVSECLERIAFCSYFNLARGADREVAVAIADRLDVALKKAVGYEGPLNLPDIERQVNDRNRPEVYSVEDKPDATQTVHDQFKRLAEAGEAWYERQERNRELVGAFERELARNGAELVVEAMPVELVDEIYVHSPSTVQEWGRVLTGLSDEALSRVHNFALLAAQTMARDSQSDAIVLFERLFTNDPHVRVTESVARISLEAISVWSARDSNEMRNLRFRRLDHASSDHMLASEVLAAIQAGKQEVLREYVLDRRARPEPSLIARAIMVSGFSEGTPWALETLDAHKDDFGFLREAQEAASYAMDRLRWSKHWAKQILDASNEIDLWRYHILLTTIVDGRFTESEIKGGQNSALVSRYAPTFRDLVRKRVDDWKKKREKTLFGMKTPERMFLN